MGNVTFEEKHSCNPGAHKSREKILFFIVLAALLKADSLQSGIPSEHYGLYCGLWLKQF